MEIHDLNEYIEAVKKFLSPGHPIWFRGISSVSHKLVPGLYRKAFPSSDDAIEVERGMITRFKQRSIPFLKERISDPWEIAFIMQHHGFPTRLLDWTENPYIALFFALTTRNKAQTDSAVVWGLNPIGWNRAALIHRSFKKEILTPYDDEANGYYDEKPGMIVNPVAIFGTYNNPRIVAQRGAFSVFGKGMIPMEDLSDITNGNDAVLSKVEIPATHTDDLLKQLLSIGYTDSVVYPDLDGLAKETKRLFNF